MTDKVQPPVRLLRVTECSSITTTDGDDILDAGDLVIVVPKEVEGRLMPPTPSEVGVDPFSLGFGVFPARGPCVPGRDSDWDIQKQIEQIEWLSRNSSNRTTATIICRDAVRYAMTGMVSEALQLFTLGHESNLLTTSRSRPLTALRVMNRALETCGVEYIPRDSKDDITKKGGISYLETGNEDATTVLYDHSRDGWAVEPLRTALKKLWG